MYDDPELDRISDAEYQRDLANQETFKCSNQFTNSSILTTQKTFTKPAASLLYVTVTLHAQ